MSASRLLIVNADDFGFTPDVNQGIVDAHRGGILTATTLMANGEAFDDAVRLAREAPTLDVGCHLVLVQGPGLPATLRALLAALACGRVRPYDEFAAQVRRILAAGIRPTHLDTHKHTHMVPSVLDAVARVAQEFSIPWVRGPIDFPPGTLGFWRRRFRRVLAPRSCRMTDHFAGYRLTGRLRTTELVALLSTLPEGLTELMTHPGYCTDALRAAPTRLTDSRRLELEALTAPETRAAIERYGIALTSFGRVSDSPSG